MNQRRPLSLHSCTFLVLAAVATTVGCGGPEVTRELDFDADITVVRAGTFRMGFLGYVSMDLEAHLKKADRDYPSEPAEMVIITFPHLTFEEVCFVADAESVRCRRVALQEYQVRMRAEKFAKLARASRVSGYFDEHSHKFRLDRAEMKVLREYAREIGVLPKRRAVPKAPRS